MNYFDSHCHLDFDVFDQDRNEVVARAQDAGIQGILNPAVDLDSSRKIQTMAEDFPMVYTAVGVHPNSALSWNNDTADSLLELASHPKNLAIGEIGLDYYRDRAPEQTQWEIFQSQLMIAQRVGLPVIIHTRNNSAMDQRATDDALSILTSWHQDLIDRGSPLQYRPGVLHSYSGNTISAEKAIALGFFIGITGPLTFKNAPELQRVVCELPLDCLLIETDSPLLTPHPYRGTRNEPAYVRLVADKIAMIHNLNPERVAEATTSNSERLFFGG